MEKKEKSFEQLLLEVQQEVGPVKKTSDNPHFRSTYADLNEVLGVVLPPLNAKGIRLTHRCGKDEFGRYVTTEVRKDSEVESTQIYLSGTEDNMQKIGAAITYARRFGIVSLLSLEQEDDDGETAVGRGRGPTVTASKPASAQIPKSLQVTPETSVVSSAPFDRALTLKTTKSYCKVAVDKKLKTVAEMNALVASYGAEKTDGLSDEALTALLTELKGLVNA